MPQQENISEQNAGPHLKRFDVHNLRCCRGDHMFCKHIHSKQLSCSTLCTYSPTNTFSAAAAAEKPHILQRRNCKTAFLCAYHAHTVLQATALNVLQCLDCKAAFLCTHSCQQLPSKSSRPRPPSHTLKMSLLVEIATGTLFCCTLLPQ